MYLCGHLHGVFPYLQVLYYYFRHLIILHLILKWKYQILCESIINILNYSFRIYTIYNDIISHSDHNTLKTMNNPIIIHFIYPKDNHFIIPSEPQGNYSYIYCSISTSDVIKNASVFINNEFVGLLKNYSSKSNYYYIEYPLNTLYNKYI